MVIEMASWTKDSIAKWLNERGLELAIDYTDNAMENRVMYVRTFSDRSVGIFPTAVSPNFRKQDELERWMETINGVF